MRIQAMEKRVAALIPNCATCPHKARVNMTHEERKARIDVLMKKYLEREATHED